MIPSDAPQLKALTAAAKTAQFATIPGRYYSLEVFGDAGAGNWGGTAPVLQKPGQDATVAKARPYATQPFEVDTEGESVVLASGEWILVDMTAADANLALYARLVPILSPRLP